MQYTFLQIILFFFIYCFLGWVWETGYVSCRQHRFVNRGFLHGPMIPIYGFGAMTILFATLPIKNNLVLVFFSGMIAASILELITGCAMESIFHVRYWDYTHIPTNIRGYISLPTSIAWGVFSVIMIKYIHGPIESFVYGFSRTKLEVCSVVLVAIASMDLALSAREAMDLKEILERIMELEKVKKAQRRVDMVVALLDSDMENLKDRIEERLEGLGKGQYNRIKSILERNPSAKSMRYEEIFDEFKDALRNLKNR